VTGRFLTFYFRKESDVERPSYRASPLGPQCASRPLDDGRTSPMLARGASTEVNDRTFAMCLDVHCQNQVASKKSR